jgi:hypothetical protein
MSATRRKTTLLPQNFWYELRLFFSPVHIDRKMGIKS